MGRARRAAAKGRFQSAAGHHRIEAFRRAGKAEADCKVSDHDDDAMLQIMIAENAGQENERFGAVLEAVAAVMVVKAYEVLAMYDTSMSNMKREDKIQLTKMLNSLLHDKLSNPSTEGGLGVKTICAFIGSQIGAAQVGSAIAAIKSSTTHLALMRRVHDRIVANFPADSIQVERASKMIAVMKAKDAPRKTNSTEKGKFDIRAASPGDAGI